LGERIPTATRRAVWQRDGGKCTYVNPETGRGCNSKRLIQIDHVIPRALGGGNELSNLRLMCREHNLFAAIQAFGVEKMSRYLAA
jgi:5-methylcytosine-specific restriction endonuclease McrA